MTPTPIRTRQRPRRIRIRERGVAGARQTTCAAPLRRVPISARPVSEAEEVEAEASGKKRGSCSCSRSCSSMEYVLATHTHLRSVVRACVRPPSGTY